MSHIVRHRHRTFHTPSLRIRLRIRTRIYIRIITITRIMSRHIYIASMNIIIRIIRDSMILTIKILFSNIYRDL